MAVSGLNFSFAWLLWLWGGCRRQYRLALILLPLQCGVPGQEAATARVASPGDTASIVYTELAAGAAEVACCEGGRLMVREPSGRTRILSEGFHSAADPDVSFDGERILFAGRLTAENRWQIYEIGADGSGLRRLTHTADDCRHPIYLSGVFTLDAAAPVHQAAFVSGGSLYTVSLDGSSLGRVTYTMEEVLEAAIVWDGRIVFAVQDPGAGAAAQRLFGVNLDGTDYALFTGEGAAGKRMPAATSDGGLVFVEPAPGRLDGAGSLAAVDLNRPLRSRKAITQPAAGLFYSPSALPGGELLVSRRGPRSFGLWRINPQTGRRRLIVDHPATDEIQAKRIAARAEPDGRSSVVEPDVPWGVLYALNVYTNDLPDPAMMPPGSVKRVRVQQAAGGVGALRERALGEAPVEDDGSFHLKVPANTPLRLELLNAEGRVLRRGAWIYVRNKEMRGCIGCHEDGELTPENREAKAIIKPAADLSHGQLQAGKSR